MKELDFFKMPAYSEEREPLYQDEARIIIALFRQGKDETRIFVEDKFPTYKIEEAKKEWIRLKEEIYARVRGELEVAPGETYEPTTKTAMQNDLSASTLFAAKDVVDDILAFDEKNPGKPLTFIQFRDKYFIKEVQEIPKI